MKFMARSNVVAGKFMLRAAAIQSLDLVQSLARKVIVCGETLVEKAPSVLLQGLRFLLGLLLLLL